MVPDHALCGQDEHSLVLLYVLELHERRRGYGNMPRLLRSPRKLYSHRAKDDESSVQERSEKIIFKWQNTKPYSAQPAALQMTDDVKLPWLAFHVSPLDPSRRDVTLATLETCASDITRVGS